MQATRLIILCLMLNSLLFLSAAVPNAIAGEEQAQEWHFTLNTVYSSRTLSGELVNKNALSDSTFGSLATTGDAMNVGTSQSMMVAVGAQYKRWGLGLNYMPTSFSGQGSAMVDLAGNNAGLRVTTPLNTDIDINMLLGNAYYNLVQTPNAMFGIGTGLGRTDIDLKIIPDLGDPIIYKGDQPFGFLSMYMANRYENFLYGFNLNGVSATFDGAKVNYSDYKVTLGYRIVDHKVKCDIVGGYRMINFKIDRS